MTAARRRAMVAALAGAALLMTGCAVPGQEGRPGSAVEFHDSGRDAITNARVAELSDAWDEAGVTLNRRQIITLELLREPLRDAASDIGLQYSRSTMESQAQLLLQTQGAEGEPSEALVDNVEAAFLLAGFTFLPQDSSVLHAIAAQIEDDAVLSIRSGDFTADQLIASVAEVAPAAADLANQGQPVWFVALGSVDGMTDIDTPWVASE